MNLKKPSPRYITKMKMVEDRENLRSPAREKQLVTFKGAPIRLSADFSTETLQARSIGKKYPKGWKARTYNQVYTEKLPFKIDR